MGTNKDGYGGSVMVADRVYDDAKTYVRENGGNIGRFFVMAAKDRLAILSAPLPLRMQIEDLVKEARKLMEPGT